MERTHEMDEQIQALAALFKETGGAHHKAFIETDGADPDWALWYADYLHDKLSQHLDATLTKSEIVYLMLMLNYEQAMDAPGSNWTHYYAKVLIERYR